MGITCASPQSGYFVNAEKASAIRDRLTAMDPQLVDKIYESCFAPEIWPEVLDEIGRIGDAPGASLFISRGGRSPLGRFA
jgi:hypothetical protein